MHTAGATTDANAGGRRLDRGDWLDITAVAAVAVLVVAAVEVGRRLTQLGDPIHAGVPPLQGVWDPRTGAGTVLAPALAVLVVTLGVRWARTASLAALWPTTWSVAAAWTLCLAWVDPWRQGVTAPLLSRFDYLAAVDRVTSWADLTSKFTESIPSDAQLPWPTHVASHPPGALAPFVLLDRLGLDGPGPAAVVVIALGTSTAVALLVAARTLVGNDAARRLAPFAALAPGAVWIVTSADAMFMAVAAWGVALTALAATSTGRRAVVAGLGAGVLLAWSLYSSYGMALIAFVVVAVLVSRRQWRAVVWLAVGGIPVVIAFTASGFWWLDGYHLVVERYHDGLGGERPQSYWWWANLAAFALAIGPAAIVGLRRATGSVRVVAWASVVAVLVATIGGLSRAEVERIWLPFGAWVLFSTIAVPATRTRVWLVAQAALVIVMAHLVLSPW